MLNSGLAILAKNTIPEHTKRGVVAQIHFCESSQSVTTRPSIQTLFKKKPLQNSAERLAYGYDETSTCMKY